MLPVSQPSQNPVPADTEKDARTLLMVLAQGWNCNVAVQE